MKKIIILSIVFLLSFSSMVAASPNHKINLEETEINQLRENLESLSIDKNTQDKLIEKMENGEMWDSMNPEKINEIDPMLLTPTMDEPIKRVVFEDGSVIENRITFLESPTQIQNGASLLGDIQPMAMRVYKYAIKISAKNGASGGGFYADYYIDGNYADGIIKVYDSYINVVAGSYTNKKVTINRGVELPGSKKPATATLSADITYVKGADTFILKMYVGNDKMMSGLLRDIGTGSIIYK